MDSIFLNGTNKDWTLTDYVKLVPAIVIAVLIFYFSSLSNPLPPGPPGPPSLIDVNIILHVCEFAGLSFFVAYGYFGKFNVKYAVFLTVVYAILDEIHQYFVPSRYFDIFDVFIDIIGVTIGFFVFILSKNLVERLYIRKKANFVDQS
jgi:VanZ family protein